MSVVVARDPLPALLAVLNADGALAAAVTGGSVAAGAAAVVRIYGEALPDSPIVHSAEPSVLPPTIVLASSSPSGDPDLAVKQFFRAELRCYETTRERARTLWYQALNALLAGTPATTNGVYVWLQRGWSGPNPGGELTSGWPVAVGMLPFGVIVSGS